MKSFIETLLNNPDVARNGAVFLFAAAIFSVGMVGLLLLARRLDPLKRRMDALMIQDTAQLSVLEQWAEKLDRFAHIILPHDQDLQKSTIDRLTRAGYRSPNSLVIYYSIRLLAMVVLPLLVLLTYPLFPKIEPEKFFYGAAIAGVLGMIVPSYYLDKKTIRGVAIFAKAFMGIPAQQAAKTTRPLMPAAAPAVLLHSLDTQQGVSNIILAMTRRDVGKPAFSLRKKTLRENTCAIASGDYSTPVSQRQHQRALRNGLPDAIDLLVVCTEAGLGLNAAILRVAQVISDIHPLLAEELLQVTAEIRAGVDRTQAMSNLARRTGLEDIKGLITVLAQSMRFGTSISQTLRIYSEEFRDKRMQKADEEAAKLGTKMIFPLIFCVMPGFFIIAMGPAVIKAIAVFSNMGH